MAKLKTDRIFQFDGGLNLATDMLHMTEKETPNCWNVDIDPRGAVSKRSGRNTFGSAWASGDDGDLVVPFWEGLGPPREPRLVVIRRYAEPFWAEPDGTQTVLGSHSQDSADSEAINAAAIANNKMFVVNGDDGTLVINADGTTQRYGTTLDTSSNHPLAKTIAFHKNKLFLGNGIPFSSTVYFTGSDADPADFSYVKSTSWFEVGYDEGDSVQKLVSHFNSLVIFKSKSIWMLRGNDERDFAVHQITDAVGTIAPRSVCVWEGGILFLSARGVFNFNGSAVQRVSTKVDPELANLESNLGLHRFDHAVVYRNKYYLWISNAGVQDVVYILDLDAMRAGNPVWTRYKDVPVWHAAVWQREYSDELYGVNDTAKDRLYRLQDGTDDNGTDIEAYITTPWLTLGNPELKKASRRFFALMDGAGQVDVDIYRDYKKTKSLTEHVIFNASYDTTVNRFRGLGSAKSFRFKVGDDSSDPWTLHGLSLVSRTRRWA